MNSKRIQFLLTGVAAWVCLLLVITTTCSGNIVIGGNYTNIATIVIINAKPGDPTGNGTALLNALAGITADVNNLYVIKLAPGIYDIGASSLQMKPYVDIEGSGENTTILSGTIDSPTTGVVSGSSPAEIRFLTVENRGGSGHSYSIAFSSGTGSPTITNVTLTAQEGNYVYGCYTHFGGPTMTNVSISVGGGTGSLSRSYGVYSDDSALTMTNVTVYVSGGANHNYGVATSSAIGPSLTNVTIRIIGDEFQTDANYGVDNNNSVTMTNVTIDISGGKTDNRGVNNNQASLTMNNVTIKVTSGLHANVLGYGIFISGSSELPVLITNVAVTTIYASQYNYAIYNDQGSTPQLRNVTTNASGGVDSFGFYNTNTGGNVTIDYSNLSGNRSVRNDNSNATVFIGSSKLAGNLVANGTIKCVGVYDANYSAITCP